MDSTTHINKSISDYLYEDAHDWLKFATRRAALLVWVGVIVAIVHFDFAIGNQIYLSVSGAQDLLTGCTYVNETEYNDIAVQKGRGRWFFVRLSKSVATFC